MDDASAYWSVPPKNDLDLGRKLVYRFAQEHLPGEFRFVRETFGIVVFEAPSDEAAGAVMRADPAVQGGFMRAELYPYQVALWAADGPTP